MPQRTLNLPSLRIVVPAVQVVYSNAMHAVRCPFTGTGYFITMALTLPPDCDVSRPISVYYRIMTTNGAAAAGVVIHWFTWARGAGDLIAIVYTLINDFFNTPTPWNANEPVRQVIDNGNGHTFDGGTFTPGDLVSFALRRMGTDANDTYNADVDYAGYLEMVYFLRCQTPCC